MSEVTKLSLGPLIPTLELPGAIETDKATLSQWHFFDRYRWYDSIHTEGPVYLKHRVRSDEYEQPDGIDTTYLELPPCVTFSTPLESCAVREAL